MKFHISYFGKTKVTVARTPIIALSPFGAVTWIRGPIPKVAIWVPTLVTPVIIGFMKTDVADETQFSNVNLVMVFILACYI